MIEAGIDRVLSHDLPVDDRVLQGNGPARQNAVAIDALTCDAVQPLGNIPPVDLDDGLLPRRTLEPDPAIAETILGNLVAVALDKEKDLPIHQSRLAKRDDAVAIREEPDTVGRPQLDEGHAATGLPVHDLDREILAGGLSGGGK
jgi:hypothetical protein